MERLQGFRIRLAFSFAHGGKDGHPFPVPVFGLARAAKAIPDQLSLFSRLFVFRVRTVKLRLPHPSRFSKGGHDELPRIPSFDDSYCPTITAFRYPLLLL
jgi:hypothetical protein